MPFRSIVPLRELVASVVGTGKASKQVAKIADALLTDGRTEFGVLLDLPEAELQRVTLPEIASAILSMRRGEVDIRPGYDGEYGVIRPKTSSKYTQQKILF